MKSLPECTLRDYSCQINTDTYNFD